MRLNENPDIIPISFSHWHSWHRNHHLHCFCRLPPNFPILTFIPTMSVRQTQRAHAREEPAASAVVVAPAANVPMCFTTTLTPTADQIKAILSSRNIASIDIKKSLVKKFMDRKDAFSEKLQSISINDPNAADDFNNIIPTSLSRNNSTNAFLGPLLFGIYSATLPIALDTRYGRSLNEDLKGCLRELTHLVQAAEHSASQELQRQFVSKFHTLSGIELTRKYLVNGYLPRQEEDRVCINCMHGSIDEPNTNRDVMVANQRKQVEFEQQEAQDKATWDAGGVVTNNRGTVLQVGRSRPRPQLGLAMYECHCKQMRCTTSIGEVPVEQCSIKCIDPETGERYGNDENGRCLCIMCKCTCRVSYCVS